MKRQKQIKKMNEQQRSSQQQKEDHPQYDHRGHHCHGVKKDLVDHTLSESQMEELAQQANRNHETKK